MPLYDYQCGQCGHSTEMFRAMSDRHSDARCPRCESRMGLVFTAPKALRTDTAFQAGFHGDGCLNDTERRILHRNAQRMGINISGKKYDGRLARFDGDPEACFGDRSECRRAIARAGYGCRDLSVRPPMDDTTGRPYRVADDIVDRHVDQIVQEEHGGHLNDARRTELREEVREKLSPSDGVCA